MTSVFEAAASFEALSSRWLKSSSCGVWCGNPERGMTQVRITSLTDGEGERVAGQEQEGERESETAATSRCPSTLEPLSLYKLQVSPSLHVAQADISIPPNATAVEIPMCVCVCVRARVLACIRTAPQQHKVTDSRSQRHAIASRQRHEGIAFCARHYHTTKIHHASDSDSHPRTCIRLLV